jgi:hypothetical protein
MLTYILQCLLQSLCHTIHISVFWPCTGSFSHGMVELQHLALFPQCSFNQLLILLHTNFKDIVPKNYRTVIQYDTVNSECYAQQSFTQAMNISVLRVMGEIKHISIFHSFIQIHKLWLEL